MGWLSFLAPVWALMGLIAVPLVLLYLLKQKRPDLQISSTILWAKTLADMRASTPFQKLRRNLLLLLQLIILAALVLTLMRPVIQAAASRTEAGVIVIDATASMQTHDGGAEESRLDRAKAEAIALVDGMRPGDRFMLIADGGGMNQVRSGFTSSKSELKDLIKSVHPSDATSDLSESLLLAATSLKAIGAEGRGGEKMENVKAGRVYLFSDGAGVKMPEALGTGGTVGDMSFERIGSSDHSVGITRLSITPVPKQEKTYEVFVGLKNAWGEDRKVGVTLAFGTKDNFLPNQAKFAQLPANGSGGVVFENVVCEPGKLFARVDDRDDDFVLDNTAFGVIAPPRKVKVVLVTTGNDFLERLVQTAVNVGQADGQIIAPQFYDPKMTADLFILDGFVPETDKLPRADTLLVRPRAAGAKVAETDAMDIGGFQVSNEIVNPAVLNWKREDPLLQYVELGDLHVFKALLLDKGAAGTGVVPLVNAPEGALVAFKDFGSVRRYFVGFSPLLESNWWQLPSLIIFMQNAIVQTRERHFIGMPEIVAAGNPARLWGTGTGTEKARVTTPDGTVVEVGARDGAAEFGMTDKVGFYDVGWKGGEAEKKATIAVNLLSPVESDIRPQPLQTREGGSKVEQLESVARQNKEIWKWLAAAGLAVLLVEWWAYHRRIG